MTEQESNDKERAEIHDALGHNTRIAILKALSEGPLGYAELKRRLGIESSGTIQHHLGKMTSLVKNELGNYVLSEKGREALLTFQPMEKYNEDARLREQIGLLIKALRSDIDSVREVVIVQLSMLGPKAVPPLISGLHHALSEKEKLEKTNDRGYYYSSNSDGEALESAITGLITTLGIIGVASTVQDIAQILPRTEAFEALSKIGNKQALNAIIALIPTWLRQNAKEYGYNSDYYSVSQAGKLDNFFRKIFSNFDDESRIALETALMNKDFAGKDVVARILAVIGDDKSVQPLVSALQNEDLTIKNEIAWALHRLKATEAVQTLIDQLFQTEETFVNTKEGRYQDSSKYYESKKTCEVLANVILMLGTINNWFVVSFKRPRSLFAEPFDYAIINSKDLAMPALTEQLKSTDNSIRSAAADMIAKITKDESYEIPKYYSFDGRI